MAGERAETGFMSVVSQQPVIHDTQNRPDLRASEKRDRYINEAAVNMTLPLETCRAEPEHQHITQRQHDFCFIFFKQFAAHFSGIIRILVIHYELF